jgi:hypothetical protein
VVGADSAARLSAAARAGDRSVALAVQSYPTLLDGDGVVPAALLGPGGGVDLGHRDARLAVGELRDGRLLVALTRFDALGAAGDGAEGGAGAAPGGPAAAGASGAAAPPGAAPSGAAPLARALARLPVGLTVPEAAALLGALGARRAVLLDGGLSAQLLVRDAGGDPRRWPGLRGVPLGLVALPR